MNMARQFASSWGRFQRVSLGFLTVVICAALVACGGGGSSSPSNEPSHEGMKTIQSASITLDTAVKAGIATGVLKPESPVEVTDVLSASYSVTGDPGTITATIKDAVCDGQPFAYVANVGGSSVSLTHPNVAFPAGANCSFTLTLTGSVKNTDGTLPTASQDYAFTVKAAAVASYKADLFITLDGEIGQSVYENGTFTDTLMTNGTQYARMVDCTMVYVADEVLYKTDRGLPVARCFDQTNVQRDVEVDVIAGKLGRTVVTPATVVTHSAGYTPSARFVAQGVSRLGSYSMSQQNPGDVHYVTDMGVMVHWVAPNGDFSKSYEVKNLVPNAGDPYKGYKGFVSVSN